MSFWSGISFYRANINPQNARYIPHIHHTLIIATKWSQYPRRRATSLLRINDTFVYRNCKVDPCRSKAAQSSLQYIYSYAHAPCCGRIKRWWPSCVSQDENWQEGSPWHGWLHIEFDRSKVKVYRPINVETEMWHVFRMGDRRTLNLVQGWSTMIRITDMRDDVKFKGQGNKVMSDACLPISRQWKCRRNTKKCSKIVCTTSDIPHHSEGQKVKVTRPLNAVTENQPYLRNGKAYELQTWYADWVQWPASPSCAVTPKVKGQC